MYNIIRCTQYIGGKGGEEEMSSTIVSKNIIWLHIRLVV